MGRDGGGDGDYDGVGSGNGDEKEEDEETEIETEAEAVTGVEGGGDEDGDGDRDIDEDVDGDRGVTEEEESKVMRVKEGGGELVAETKAARFTIGNGLRSLRSLYEGSGFGDGGKYTVPILYDTETATVVTTESTEIVRVLNSCFDDYATNPGLDLYPPDLREEIDEVNSWVRPCLNNGVYRCGFATSQDTYDAAIMELTEAFDRVDSILQRRLYVAGDVLTEADVGLFVTLLRYDEVYAVYFKANTRTVAQTPAVLEYCRRVFFLAGVADTCDMGMIKEHYYKSHAELNPYGVIPAGRDFMGLLKEGMVDLGEVEESEEEAREEEEDEDQEEEGIDTLEVGDDAEDGSI